MKESAPIKIKYKSGLLIENKKKGQEYKEYAYDYITVQTSHVKRYNNTIMLLMGITGCELHLIEWASNNMTEGGLIHNNDYTRKAFISFHEKHKKSGNKSYSDHSVKKAFHNLVLEGLLLPKVRGMYQVSPLYYYRGEDADRIKSIKLIMEFTALEATKVNVEVDKK